MPLARRPVRSLRVTNARIRNEQDSHRRQAVSDRLSFCRHDAESLLKLSGCPLVSWCLGGSLGWVGGSGSICVICGQSARLCVLCASVVLLTLSEDQATGGRMDPELSNLTARLPVVQDMQAGADLMTCSTNTASGM